MISTQVGEALALDEDFAPAGHRLRSTFRLSTQWSPAVLTEGLTKRFGAFTAVDHLDLRVEAGELYGFLGPNGAGKSTTLRMLCGILEPTDGGGRVARHRPPPGARADQGRDRLHVAAVLALRRPDRGGEPGLLREVYGVPGAAPRASASTG